MAIGLLLPLGFVPLVAYAAGRQDSAMRIVPLAILQTNGHGIVQAPGPLKSLARADASNPTSARRFLVATTPGDLSQAVLRQKENSNGNN
jgi:hypothetical protein